MMTALIECHISKCQSQTYGLFLRLKLKQAYDLFLIIYDIIFYKINIIL